MGNLDPLGDRCYKVELTARLLTEKPLSLEMRLFYLLSRGYLDLGGAVVIEAGTYHADRQATRNT